MALCSQIAVIHLLVRMMEMINCEEFGMCEVGH